jgi:hypothetical protein
MSITEITVAIACERDRQNRLLREGKIANDCASPNVLPVYKVAVLGEEFGEVCKAVIERQDKEQLIKELVQIAAVSIAWLESL